MPRTRSLLLAVIILVPIGAVQQGCGGETQSETATARAAEAGAEKPGGGATTNDTQSPESNGSDVLRGEGPAIHKVRIRSASPLVIDARHSGPGKFVVTFAGGVGHILLKRTGSFNVEMAHHDMPPALYRIRIEAEGRWRLHFTQPTPTGGETELPATITGTGWRVTPVRIPDHRSLTVTARHRGSGTFLVSLLAYGDLTGFELLFYETGNFAGQTKTSSLPAGAYLLAVEADGAWSVDLR